MTLRWPRPRTAADVAMGLAQVTDQWIGRTTLAGVGLYEAVTIGWLVWLITGRMWGFLPLNICATAVSTYPRLNLIVRK